MDITFLGGTGTVTGSKFLVHADGTRVLIDCGYFQGLKQHRLLNWEPLPFDAKAIDAVILTHAHLDHSGYLPVLVRQGFRGPIYCTPPTKALTRILLLDAAHIQEEDARYANKKGFSKHLPALPLFTSQEAENIWPMLKTLKFAEKQKIGSLEFSFKNAGHILGASSVSLKNHKWSVLFSGDLGRKSDPLMPPPAAAENHDFIVMESTYGERQHSQETSGEILHRLIDEIEQKKSVLLIPSFAVGRAQNLLYEISNLMLSKEVPRVPIYVNSPMGTEVTELYHQYKDYHKLTEGHCRDLFTCAQFIGSAEESKQLNLKKGPMVIIAASGMLTGGRVLHHLKAFAGNPQNIILLAGFQAAGTRGWTLKTGGDKLKVHGEYIPIKAKVVNSDSFSAHADQKELLEWLSQITQPPKAIFIVHGEPTASDELRKQIDEQLHFPAFVPSMNQMISLDYYNHSSVTPPSNS